MCRAPAVLYVAMLIEPATVSVLAGVERDNDGQLLFPLSILAYPKSLCKFPVDALPMALPDFHNGSKGVTDRRSDQESP